MMKYCHPELTQHAISQVVGTLESGQWAQGPEVRQLEDIFADFCGAEYAVAVSSCTAALYLMVRHAWGVEFTIPALTHVATAQAALLGSARNLSFVDVDEMGLVEADDANGMPLYVDLLGNRREGGHFYDCAHSLGRKHTGDVTCYSFYPTKHISCGEGGMLVTNNPDIAADARSRRSFGYADKHGPYYDVDRLGFNYRMTEMQATIAIEQLGRFGWMQDKREENFNVLLDAVLPHVEVMEHQQDSALYCLNVLVEDRDRIFLEMQEAGMPVSINYATPVPLLSYYRKKYGYKEGDFPVAEDLCRRIISLPVGPHLTTRDIQTIAESLKSVL